MAKTKKQYGKEIKNEQYISIEGRSNPPIGIAFWMGANAKGWIIELVG